MNTPFFILNKSERLINFEKTFSDCYKECCCVDQELNSSNFVPESLSNFVDFLPTSNFAEENSVPENILISYRYHYCNCLIVKTRRQHCLLKNVFATYHPISGVVTSLVNSFCVKRRCDNKKTSKSTIPSECRNYRQVVLSTDDHLQNLFTKNVIKNLESRRSGKILLCLNHLSSDDQIYFWTHGFLRDRPELFHKNKIDSISVSALTANDFESFNTPLPLTTELTEEIYHSSSVSDESSDENFSLEELFSHESIKSLLEFATVTSDFWCQFFDVVNKYQNTLYFHGLFELDSYLKWNKSSDEFFLCISDSTDKLTVFATEIKVVDSFLCTQLIPPATSLKVKKHFVPQNENFKLSLLVNIYHELNIRNISSYSETDQLFELQTFIYDFIHKNSSDENFCNSFEGGTF